MWLRKRQRINKTMFNLNDYQQKANIQYLKALNELPPAGGDCNYHTTIMGLANLGVRSGRDDETIFNDIRNHTKGSRDVPDDEIRKTVDHARRDYDLTRFSNTISKNNRNEIKLNRIKHDEELCKWLCERFNIPPTTDDDLAKYKTEMQSIDGMECDDLFRMFPNCADTLILLDTLYKPNDFIFIGDDKSGDKNVKTAKEWRDCIIADLNKANKKSSDEISRQIALMGAKWPKLILNPLDGIEQPKKSTPNEKSKRGENNVLFPIRFVLFECDGLSKTEQWRMAQVLHNCGFIIKAVTDSGGKSLHTWIDATSVKSADEWKKLVHDRLFSCLCRLGADGACATLARLGRLAGMWRGEKRQFQRLLWIDKENRAGNLEEATRQLEAVINQFDMEQAKTTQKIIEHATETKGWRVTLHDVENALTGTALGKMAEIFCSVANPPLPLQYGLSKAVTLAAVCTSQRSGDEIKTDDANNDSKTKEETQRIENKGRKNRPIGADLARLKTTTDCLLNAYVLLVAPPASGKDYGGLLSYVVRQLDMYLGTDASGEGWLDELINHNNGLLEINEMEPYIQNGSNYQNNAISTITNLYNNHFFKSNLSKRSKAARNCPNRESDYVAPNIFANIQPDVINKKASSDLLNNGCLSRFLMFKGESSAFWDGMGGISEKRAELLELTKWFLNKAGVVQVPPNYASAFMREFGEDEATANATLQRYVREYYPRLACWLSIRENDNYQEIRLENDDWERARVIIKWIYGMAKDVLSGISDATPNERREIEMADAIYKFIQTLKNVPVTLSVIANKFQKKCSVEIRNKALLNLIEQDKIHEKVVTAKNGHTATFYILAQYDMEPEQPQQQQAQNIPYTPPPASIPASIDFSTLKQ